MLVRFCNGNCYRRFVYCFACICTTLQLASVIFSHELLVHLFDTLILCCKWHCSSRVRAKHYYFAVVLHESYYAVFTQDMENTFHGEKEHLEALHAKKVS